MTENLTSNQAGDRGPEAGRERGGGQAHLEGEPPPKGTELETALARYYDLYNLAPVGYLTLSDEFHILEANRTAADLVGTTENLLSGQLLSHFVHLDDRPVLSEFRALLLEKGTLQECELRLQRQDGTQFWVRLRATAARNTDDARVCRAVMSDITRQKQAEEALRASEEKFRIIANHTVNWESWFGPDGNCIWVNPVVWYITGYTTEEIMAMALPEFINTVVAEEHRALFSDRAREALEGNRVGDFEFRCMHRNGTQMWASTSWQPVHDGAGNFLGIRASGRDITARKLAEAEKERLEAQLLQSQKMEAVGQLAGGVAHDFNNLLHVILGYTNILRGRLAGSTEDRHAIEQVHRAAERAADLTRQLLAFSRRQIIQPVALDLNTLIQGILKMLRAAVGAHIDLLFMPGARLGVVLADRGQIEQVLMNLCVNARDAMPAGGTLTIETKDVTADDAWCRDNPWAAPGHHVLLRVADTGHGMDAVTRGQIFEPFFTTKEVGQGTGLGLAMVYGIVKHHGGLIHVESEPGTGARFDVYLPVADRPAETPAPSVRAGADGGVETVLVAEDEDMVRELVRSILEDAGYAVLTAGDGAEAVRVIDEHVNAIDLALLDVMMPRGGGRMVMEHIQEKSPRTRVLFSSAYSESTVHLNFVIKEGLDLLVKPYSRAELLHAVRGALDLPGD
jgi:PAS domain S-box-containing protein